MRQVGNTNLSHTNTFLCHTTADRTWNPPCQTEIVHVAPDQRITKSKNVAMEFAHVHTICNSLSWKHAKSTCGVKRGLFCINMSGRLMSKGSDSKLVTTRTCGQELGNTPRDTKCQNHALIVSELLKSLIQSPNLDTKTLPRVPHLCLLRTHHDQCHNAITMDYTQQHPKYTHTHHKYLLRT